MDSKEPEIIDAQHEEDRPPSANGNGFLKSSNGHAIGSTVGVKREDLDDELALAWHKQSQPYKIPKRKGKRKTESLLAVLCQWVVEHQIGRLAEYCIWGNY